MSWRTDWLWYLDHVSLIWRAKTKQKFKPFPSAFLHDFLKRLFLSLLLMERQWHGPCIKVRGNLFQFSILLGMELRLSGWAASTLTHWASSLALPSIKTFVVSCCYGLNGERPSQTRVFEHLGSGNVVLFWETVEPFRHWVKLADIRP